MEKLEGVVTSKGQLVIPAKLRRALRIEKGTRVRFHRIKGGIAIYPKQFEDIERFHGIFAGLGLPRDIEKEPDREIERRPTSWMPARYSGSLPRAMVHKS